MLSHLSVAVLAMSLGNALAYPSATIPFFEKLSKADTAPLTKRSDIASNAVVGFATTVPSGTEGTLMKKYWPYLKVVDGCVPFPAVDKSGNTNAGLNPTGAADGDCSSSTGQVYGRAETYKGYYSIMYSYFMPKDEPNALEGALDIGHRYDWENAVIVLSSESTSATLVAMAASQHGNYTSCKGTACNQYVSGGRPLLQYFSEAGVLDHSLGFTTTVGGTQPLIAWESLPAVAQSAITNKDWGAATPSFLNSNFASYLAEAYEVIGI